MINLGIHDGDFAIIHSQNSAQNGDIVAAIIDGEATLKKFYRDKNKVQLIPANDRFSTIEINNNSIQLAGILTGLIRSY